VLSAQATDAGVNKATRELFKVADTPQKMLDLGEERLRDYIGRSASTAPRPGT
jgi:endonuclease-3